MCPERPSMHSTASSEGLNLRSLLLACVVLATVGCGAQVEATFETVPTTEGSATLEPSVVTLAPSPDLTDWSKVASFEGEGLGVLGLVHGPAGYLAIGNDRDDEAPRGRVWLSSDGLSWELLPPGDVFARAYLTHLVVASDGRYLAFGRIEDVSHTFDEVPLATWETADGRSWRRTELGLPTHLSSVHVAAGDKGYLLAGSRPDPNRYELWLSADARTWELVRELPPISTGTTYQNIGSIAAGPEGFVAAGSRESAPYVIASGDGREWFEAAPVQGLGLVPAIAPLAGDWITAGGLSNGPIPVWFSPNGLDWEQVATFGTDSEAFELYSLVSTGDRVFAQLTVLGEHPAVLPAGLWSSTDGTIWEEVGAASDVFLAGAASSGDMTVLAGTGPEGTVFIVRRSG
jgi:hypothetical protein